jgi:methylglyoxal reductase
MKMKKLGSAGPEISVIGFGAWEAGGHWGEGPGDEATIAAMRAGFDAGMNWIDTAEAYGHGKSESLVADALEGRDDVYVFTKLAPKPAGHGFTPDEVRAGCEESLRFLRRDVIDLYQLHWPDQSVPLEETWGAMASLVDEGKVRWIGVSNFDQEKIETCEAIRHVDCLQPNFSILNPQPRTNLLPFCERNGTGVIAYGPLGFGLLSGNITMETTFDADDWRSGHNGVGNAARYFAPDARAKHLEVVDALRPIAEHLGISLSQLALAWVFHQKGVTGAIVGSRNAAHTLTNAHAGAISLDEVTLKEMEHLIAD